MSIKAGGRVALIAAGLCVGVLGLGWAGAPSVAAPSQSENVSTAKTVKQVRYYKRYVSRKTVRASQKSIPTPKAAEAEIAEAGGTVTIPASVANANAAIISDPPTGTAKAMTTRANALLMAGDTPAEPPQAPAADTQVVAADQLNEVDRALQEQPANSQTTVALAPTKQVAQVATQAAANDTSTWDQTSLIGKIFIAFGALLTIASAARMFMA
jgi:hypothetical protein